MYRAGYNDPMETIETINNWITSKDQQTGNVYIVGVIDGDQVTLQVTNAELPEHDADGIIDVIEDGEPTQLRLGKHITTPEATTEGLQVVPEEDK